MSGQSEVTAWVAKELSWLSFNERVLQEAADPDVPVIQRIRYLGIFSNNLDEFFRVRVADVRRLAAFSPPSKQEEFKVLLEEIRQKVMKLQQRFDAMYRENLKELRRRKIYLINERQLDEPQTKFVRSYFHSHIQQELVPIILDDANPIPELNDASIDSPGSLHPHSRSQGQAWQGAHCFGKYDSSVSAGGFPRDFPDG